MNCRKSVKGLVLGAMVAVAPMVSAQMDTTGMSTTTMTSSTMAPTALTGTVLRYYTDRSGYVTAMDVQTAEGVRMVRFAPNMAQRLYTTYPVGGQATVYVQNSPWGGSSRYDVVGFGPAAPSYMMQPYMVRDVDLLDSEPMIMMGTKLQSYRGRLDGLIYNGAGEVVALVLDRVSSGGQEMGDNVLVRVGRMFRQISPGAGMAASERVAPAFKGADVDVTGYAEAPMYGVVSGFPNRVIANAININRRSVGSLGFPNRLQSNAPLFGFDLGGTEMTPEEVAAGGQGYMPYQTPGTMSGGTSSNTGTMGTGGMGTGGAGSTTTTGGM